MARGIKVRCPNCNSRFVRSEDIENKSQRELLAYQCDHCGWAWVHRQHKANISGPIRRIY